VTFRARLLVAFTAATLLPLGILAFGVRRQVEDRLTAQYRRRADALARVAAEDLARESASIASRLSTLAGELSADNRFRLAAVHDAPAERVYLLDYAAQAMQLTGLSMLQVQNEEGRILSSGHFRNEFGRLEPELPRLLAQAQGGYALARARAPEGAFLVLARMDSVTAGGRRFTLVGGTAVDGGLLRKLAREGDLSVSLALPESASAPAALAETAPIVRRIPLPYVLANGDGARLANAELVVGHTTAELEDVLRQVDRWFLAALALTAAVALALGAWLSSRISRPIARLAQATTHVTLDGPEVELAGERDDEVGTLARRLSAMTRRLRANAARLRDAERLATVGEMARQVNHDVKNGLIPIRNVLRHLVQVQEREPANLAAIFAERRATLESSVEYLDTLARNYARLTPKVDRRRVDVNAVVRDVVGAAGVASVRARLDDALPAVSGDPVVLRRILDNLVRNAVESLPDESGTVTVRTSRADDGSVRVIVADTGRGMTEQELSRAFDDFYTTKQGGTGLGLSVVRRLTADLEGRLRVTSTPGQGTSFTLDLPTVVPRSPADELPSSRPSALQRSRE
jgi:signal transduction histidine kinase